MRRFRSTMLLFALLSLGVLIFAAGVSARGTAGVLIGESSPVASNPHQAAITYGARQASKQLGWSFKSLDANLSPGKQVSDVDTFVNLDAKGIITWTMDPGAAGAAYKRAQKKGIPLIDFGSTQNVTTTIFDERGYGCSMGKKAATYISSRIKGAKVLMIGGPPVPVIANYTACFEKAAKIQGLVILERQDNVKDTAATAQPLVQDMFTKHPDAQAIWTYNDNSALGAGAVLRSSGKDIWIQGKQEGIIVTGANGTKDAAAGVKAGLMTVTWDARPADLGRIAVQVLAMRLRDKRPLASLPKMIVVPMTPWDVSNIGSYVAPLKRKVSLTPIPKTWIVKK